MTILKNIGAVFAGFLTVVILSVGTDAVLEAAGIFPSQEHGLFITWMLAVALAYRSVYTVAGGFVTAQLAPSDPMKHVKILASIGTAAGIAGVIIGWDLSQHWYPIAIAVTAFPLTWFGGWLKTRARPK
ncbi:MAG: hypothetical protein ACOYNS_08505 [Bacteroidota bacterium]